MFFQSLINFQVILVYNYTEKIPQIERNNMYVIQKCLYQEDAEFPCRGLQSAVKFNDCQVCTESAPEN